MMQSSAVGRTYAGLIAFCSICIIGFAITVICLNRYQLYNVYGWCSYWYGAWYTQCYIASNSCWFSTDPWNDMTACRYLYSVGAVALFLQCFVGIAACVDKGMAYGCLTIFGFINFCWWLAAGIYFTNQIKLVDDTTYNGQAIPAGNYRKDVEGVVWAAFAVSFVQFVAVIASWLSSRGRGGGEGGNVGTPAKAEQQYNSEMAPPPLPTYQAPPYGGAPPPAQYGAPGYPAPPPGGYPAPAPGGYPAPPPEGYPPAPAAVPPKY